MLRSIRVDEQLKTSSIGEFCPYWMKAEDSVVVGDTAEEMFRYIPEDARVIDPSAVQALLQFNYMLGRQTLVAGVHRMLWRESLSGSGVTLRAPPIPHRCKSVSAEEAARQLIMLLAKELLLATANCRRVFLLLSGGLDSRIVAGVLKRIEEEIDGTIHCVSWGREQSRDVEFARRIAGMMEWEHSWIPYNHELGWENIHSAAIWGGAECTGLHLHGLEWSRQCTKQDVVIAATLGDSVGRGVYSGRHVSEVFTPPIINVRGLLCSSTMKTVRAESTRQRATAWDSPTRISSVSRVELDLQENYLRRMLCHAMDYVRQHTSLHQAFSSPDLVEYMWSLSPDSRTDAIYENALQNLDRRLVDIPWARTGKTISGKGELDVTLHPMNHDWLNWPRTVLRSQLEELYFSKGLSQLGLFQERALTRLWKTFTGPRTPNLRISEDIVKIASIELARRAFGLRCEIASGSLAAGFRENAISVSALILKRLHRLWILIRGVVKRLASCVRAMRASCP